MRYRIPSHPAFPIFLNNLNLSVAFITEIWQFVELSAHGWLALCFSQHRHRVQPPLSLPLAAYSSTVVLIVLPPPSPVPAHPYIRAPPTHSTSSDSHYPASASIACILTTTASTAHCSSDGVANPVLSLQAGAVGIIHTHVTFLSLCRRDSLHPTACILLLLSVN